MEASKSDESAAITKTTSPTVTGTSVIAIKYKDGVMMMADTLGSYGTLARFTELDRIRKVNDYTLVGAGGEWSDFEYITKLLNELVTEDFEHDDGHTLTPKQTFSYLSRVLYNRRTRVDPLWNQLVIGGVRDGQSFLGCVDLYGSAYEDDIITTGFGTYLAAPLLRKHWRANMDEKEARALLEDAERVLYYRDCRTINKFTLGIVTKAGTSPDKSGKMAGPQISKPFSVTTQWRLEAFFNAQ